MERYQNQKCKQQPTDIIMTKSIKEMYSLGKQKLVACFFLGGGGGRDGKNER